MSKKCEGINQANMATANATPIIVVTEVTTIPAAAPVSLAVVPLGPPALPVALGCEPDAPPFDPLGEEAPLVGTAVAR